MFFVLLPSGVLSIPIGMLLISISVYIIQLEIRYRHSEFNVYCSVAFILFVLIIFATPQNHIGHGFHENGETMILKHEHWLWQNNHIH